MHKVPSRAGSPPAGAVPTGALWPGGCYEVGMHADISNLISNVFTHRS